MATSICWGSLFCLLYLRLGFYHPSTLSVFIIIAGVSSGASSGLYAQPKILIIYLIFCLIIPSLFLIFKEPTIAQKLFGLLFCNFFIFLYAQSNINRKNLIARIELSYYSAEEAKRIDQLFASVPGIFCYFQIKGKILASNQMWSEFSSEFGDQTNFYHGLNNEFKKLIEDFIDSEQDKLSSEFSFKELKGSPVFICTAQKISSTQGIILFMIDITSMKLIEEEMKLKNAHLQHSARLIELGEMVGGVAHEINNPLAVVVGRTQLVKRMVKNNVMDLEKMASNLEIIEISSHRISRLIDGMKSLVRNSENDQPTDQSLGPHLEIVNFLVKNKAELHKVNFEIEMMTSDLFGFCRPSQIEQVLINLVNNAIDAAEATEEKWVKLKVTSNSNYLIFEVIDSGKGIAEDLLKKIWNPFFTTKEIGKGTGLGLSISHSIVTSNNGHFYYKPDCTNTTFVVEIPKYKLAA